MEYLGAAMPHSSRYAWSEAYKAAALETDFAKLNLRIDAALTAIEKRLDGDTKLAQAEFDELQAALHSLYELSSERATR
jgi:hypothetical protein